MRRAPRLRVVGAALLAACSLEPAASELPAGHAQDDAWQALPGATGVTVRQLGADGGAVLVTLGGCSATTALVQHWADGLARDLPAAWAPLRSVYAVAGPARGNCELQADPSGAVVLAPLAALLAGANKVADRVLVIAHSSGDYLARRQLLQPLQASADRPAQLIYFDLEGDLTDAPPLAEGWRWVPVYASGSPYNFLRGAPGAVELAARSRCGHIELVTTQPSCDGSLWDQVREGYQMAREHPQRFYLEADRGRSP